VSERFPENAFEGRMRRRGLIASPDKFFRTSCEKEKNGREFLSDLRNHFNAREGRNFKESSLPEEPCCIQKLIGGTLKALLGDQVAGNPINLRKEEKNFLEGKRRGRHRAPGIWDCRIFE